MSDLFPPIQYLNDREPWGVPQYIPPSPHNLPTRPEPGAAPNTTQSLFVDGINVRETYRYVSVVSVSVNVPALSSIKFLDAPIGKRNFLGFRNASVTANIFIDFNADANINSWLRIVPGSIILFDVCVPQDDLYALADAAGGLLAYAYSTFPG